jgi:hypothetical protein
MRGGLECTAINNGYRCLSLAGAVGQGRHDYEVTAQDYEMNLAQEQGMFVFDNRSVSLDMAQPAQGSYTGTTDLYLELSDMTSGIKYVSIQGLDGACNISDYQALCSFSAGLANGRNTLLIETQDNAGNSDMISYTVYFDNTPPAIILKEYTVEIIEDSGLQSLLVNKVNYEISNCIRGSGKYVCPTEFQVLSAVAVDLAGNMASKQ